MTEPNARIRIAVFALLAALIAPPALAQTDAGPGDSIPLYRFPLSEETREQIRQRQGDEQTTLELVQTTLLNRFGELGFSRLIDIGKLGESYFALVETTAGAEALVHIDPLPRTEAVGAVEDYPAEQRQ